MKTAYRVVDRDVIKTDQEDGPVLVYIDPSDKEREELSGRFRIDVHNLRCALDPDEPSRLEKRNDHLTLIFKIPRNYSAENRLLFKVSSAGFFLYPDRFVIVSASPFEAIPEKLS